MKKTIALPVVWSCLAVMTISLEFVLAVAPELDLSEPKTIAMIMGKYEGGWTDTRSSRHGALFVNFSMNPNGGEKPFAREARFIGSSTLDPNKASVIGGKRDRNTLVFSHTSGWSKYTFYEENGQIKARGEYRYKIGPMAGTEGIYELSKMGEGAQVSEQRNH